MTPKDTYAVIMAGGKGERFWPLSRASKPKQLLSLLGGRTMLEETVARLDPVIPTENIIVITNKSYEEDIRSLLAHLPEANIIGEPCGRDTAPCIALAAAFISAKNTNPNAAMIVLPADHVINDTESFQRVIEDCAKASAKGHIVTIGITPNSPSTAYGYIKCSSPIDLGTHTRFLAADKFIEKPDIETARALAGDPAFKWNSGMFAWSVSTIIAALHNSAQEIASKISIIKDAVLQDRLDKTLESVYTDFPKISIDYAVMEKSKAILVAECSFDWDDIGNWTALRNQISPDDNNNTVKGLHLGINTTDTIVYGDGSHLVATVGVKDLIIVQTNDATLVCSSESSQRIKEILRLAAENNELKRFT